MNSKFRLVDLKFTKIAFNLNESFDSLQGTAIQVNYDFSFNVQIALPEGHEKLEADTLVTESKTELGVSIFKKANQDGIDANVPFTIDLVVAGYFEMEQPVRKEELERFSSLNGMATLLPYVRMMISTLTSGANVPPLILPLINVQAVHNGLRQQQEATSEN